jgi:N-acetylglucosamine-6-phosphate deacetylase
MDTALRNLVELGWDIEQASSAVARSPAAAIRRIDLGILAVGGAADVVVVDDDLSVVATMVAGEETYRR